MKHGDPDIHILIMLLLCIFIVRMTDILENHSRHKQGDAMAGTEQHRFDCQKIWHCSI